MHDDREWRVNPHIAGKRPDVRGLPVEEDVDRELSAYLDMRIEELIAEGWEPESARQEALRRFGDPERIRRACEKETRMRDRILRLWRFLQNAGLDLRIVSRQLLRNPVYSFSVILILAIGICGITTMFSLVNGVLLKPLPYERSNRLCLLFEKIPGYWTAPASYPDFLDWRQRNTHFENMVAYSMNPMNLTGTGEPERITAVGTSAATLSMLQVQPILGRDFLPEDDQINAERVAILSYQFWTEHLENDPEVVGRTLILNDRTCTVIGVLPDGFIFPPRATGADIYMPLEQLAQERVDSGGLGWIEQRGWRHLNVLARLRPGIPLVDARMEMDRVALELAEEFPATNANSQVAVFSMHDLITRSYRDTLIGLLFAVSFVLLIACSNVASLLLARSTSRRQELAVRTSLGAGKGHIVRLLLSESLILWFLGGGVGIGLALYINRFLVAFFTRDLPPIFTFTIDSRVVLTTLFITLLTGIGFGLIPVFNLRRKKTVELLKQSDRISGSLRRKGIRGTLITVQVTIVLVMSITTGLLTRSYMRMLGADPGFESEGILTVRIDLPRPRYRDVSQQAAFFNSLLERTRALQETDSAALSWSLPLTNLHAQNGFTVEGAEVGEQGFTSLAEFNRVSTDYFRTLRIPLLHGRAFNRGDCLPEAAPVIIVDEGLAQHYWPDSDPIGKRLKWGDYESANPWMEIVGVAAHVSVNGVAQSSFWQTYVPHGQADNLSYALLVKTNGDPTRLVEPVRAEVAGLDSSLPIYEVVTMEELQRATFAGVRYVMLILGLFASISLIIAMAGLYGVVSYTTAERRHEIGIRMACGAHNSSLFWLVIRQGMSLVIKGTVIGLIIALVTGIGLSRNLYGLSWLDLPTFIVIPLLLGLTALLAITLPAWRSTTVDVVEVLRDE